MDLEHLNKHQVILLALLASFVTSIATGIVTVSLMNQAPPQVAATVNHIIERTVQEVAAPTQAAAPAATTIKTVVVQSDDLAAQSIAGVQKSIIRLVASSSPDLLVARGLIVAANGTAITDRGSLDPNADYIAILADGTKVPATLTKEASTSPVAYLKLALATSTAVSAATLADESKLQLGQTVIRIGGTGSDTVGQGVIASLQKDKDGVLRYLESTVTSATPGSVLINLFGEVVGIITTDAQAQGTDYYSIPSASAVHPATPGTASTTASH